MSISIYGTHFPMWFWLPTALVLAVIAGLSIYGMRLVRRERSEELEAGKEYDDDQPAAPLEDAPASEDDLYPASPPIHQAAMAGAPEESAPAAADAQPATGELTHQLAALTEGETVIEEIERLEARLAVLYDLLGEEIAADVEKVDLMLASGALAAADWLPHPYTYPMPAAFRDGPPRPHCQTCCRLPGDPVHDPRRWDINPWPPLELEPAGRM